jgi:hypothetical protein
MFVLFIAVLTGDRSTIGHEELNNVLVTDYLRYYYVTSSQGTNLFDYLFPPYGGDTREFIVKVALVAEAASYLEYGKGELARNMSETSIMEVFSNPEEALEEASNPPWKPYLQATNIPLTEIKRHYTSDNKNKRTRHLLSDKRNSRSPMYETQTTNNNYNHTTQPYSYYTAAQTTGIEDNTFILPTSIGKTYETKVIQSPP